MLKSALLDTVSRGPGECLPRYTPVGGMVRLLMTAIIDSPWMVALVWGSVP